MNSSCAQREAKCPVGGGLINKLGFLVSLLSPVNKQLANVLLLLPYPLIKEDEFVYFFLIR